MSHHSPARDAALGHLCLCGCACEVIKVIEDPYPTAGNGGALRLSVCFVTIEAVPFSF